MMRFLRRSLSGLFLLAVTVGLLVWAGVALNTAIQVRLSAESRPGMAQERVFAVNVARVETGVVAPILTTFGEVLSRRTLELRATTAGAIVELADNFVEGGVVTAGDVLLRIDPTNAEAALAVARADLHEAEARLRETERSLEITRDDLESVQAQAALREQALERQRSLQARGVATDAAVEEAALAAASSAQAVLSRRQAVANAQSARDQADTGLLRAQIALAAAERDLADTQIVAGFSGTLAGVRAVEGAIVTPNEQIGSLIDPDALEVSFRVSAAQYARLVDEAGRLVGGDVTVSLDVSGVNIMARGRISRESASVTAGQTGRLLFARLDQAGGFRPGDFVSVMIEEPPLADVARLPASAVDAGGGVLMVSADNRLSAEQVTILRRQDNDVLVSVPDHLVGRDIVAERTPLLGAGILVRPLGRATAPDGIVDDSALLELTPERRAALVAYVESSDAMPADLKARMLAELGKDMVSASMIARLEQRIGG
ncbi:MAG: HlyD family efflux transporter periplasmic adaptor subunit [Paracoccaceae bacterium]